VVLNPLDAVGQGLLGLGRRPAHSRGEEVVHTEVPPWERGEILVDREAVRVGGRATHRVTPSKA
jgi:hypothetical protein